MIIDHHLVGEDWLMVIRATSSFPGHPGKINHNYYIVRKFEATYSVVLRTTYVTTNILPRSVVLPIEVRLQRAHRVMIHETTC